MLKHSKPAIKRLLVSLSFSVFFGKVGFSQIYIGGPTCVESGVEYSYYISGNYDWSDYFSWYISGGVSVYGNTYENGTSLTYLRIRFTSSSGYISVNCSSGSANLYVNITSSLNAGSITSNGSQTINYNATPGSINCSLASGGYCNPVHSYQWQQSTDGTNWSDMPGKTSPNLSFSTGLTQTSYFRRKVTESYSGSVGYSNTATVYVNPPLNANTLSPSSQNIFSGDNASTISGGPGYGPTGSYSYQWQYSSNNNTFYDISGATNLSYSPGSLTSTTYYRRKVTCGSEVAYTPSVVVNIYQHLASGSINPYTYNTAYNTSPGQLSATAATGGICGSYSYQWQQQTGNGNWADISGATGQNYTPGAITITTYYRRRVICGSETQYTNTAVAMFALTSGTVSGGTSPILQGASPGQLTMSASSGGDCNNSWTYQWQQSTDGTNFSDLSAYGQTYTPGALNSTTYFRCKTSCGSSTVYSNARTIVVNPPLSAGSISPTSLAILYNTNPGQLTGTSPTGGICSGYTYDWEWSPNNNNWYSLGVSTQNFSPGNLTGQTYFFRRKAMCGSETQYSNVSYILVYNQVSSGTVTGGNPSIFQGDLPGQLSVGIASNGNCGGSYTYQWEQSTDGSNFTPISGATGFTYTPPALYVTTYYRNTVTCSGVTASSNIRTLAVYPHMNAGSITTASFEAPFNTVPSAISATASTGGDGSPYQYQWMYSTDNTNFTPISGATSKNYNFPTVQTQGYFYKRKTTCGVEIEYTNSISVNVACSWGDITTCSQLIQPGGSVASFILSNSGGSVAGSTTAYQWESSTDEINWSTISDATGTSLSPSSPSATTYYRVKVTCNNVSLYANTVRIKVKGTVSTNIPNTSTATSNQTAVAMPSYPSGTDANNQNYVRSRSFTKPGITDITTANAQTAISDVAQVTEYVDGLGRPIQSVVKAATPSGYDMVATTWYDEFGREAQKYLPYTDNLSSGNFRTNPNTQQPGFYNGYFNNSESFYYSNSIIEASPLNRVLKEAAPGKSWTGSARGTRVEQRTNRKEEDVKIWSIGTSTGAVPSVAGIYNKGQLFVTETTDESESKVIEYKDKEGKVILKKVLNNDVYCESYNGWISTYYVYDDFGRLRWVLQPKAVEWLVSNSWNLGSNTTVQNELCFRYEYDARGRMIIKKVPGAGEVWMVYDDRDRLVMTQDANLRAQSTKQWLVTKYDDLNRPTGTGLLNDVSNRSYHETQAAVGTIPYPLTSSGYDVLTETYYDSYAYTGAKTYDASLNSSLDAGSNPYPETVANGNLTKGMVTGTRTKVLGTSIYLLSTIYYDSKGRVVETRVDNVSGGEDITVNQYDFSGKVLSSYTRHQKPSNTTINILTKMAYDHTGRILNIKKSVNGTGEKLIVQNSYDELGQLKKKDLGQKTDLSFLETLDYNYNIRGWLTSINKDFATDSGTNANNRYFGMELFYDYGFAQNQFNGNIGGVKWRSRGDGEQRAYGFDYDNVNRLTKADFTQNNSGWNISAGIDFSLSNLSYDVNGNIKTMWQKGWNLTGSNFIDKLNYDYGLTTTGNELRNKLYKVSDDINSSQSKLGDFKDGSNTTSDDYDFDDNGNLKLDNNKVISSITYNYLNLPSIITVTGKGNISYVYDATGNKLKKIVTEGGNTTTTTYIGGFIYEQKNSGSDDLQFVSMEEGRIRPVKDVSNNITGFNYDYFIKDHLGNVRMVLTDETKTDYYPAATMEASTINSESSYYSNLTSTQYSKPSWFSDPAYTSSSQVARMKNSVGSQKIGPAILLKVMAGDSYNIRVASGWSSGSSSTNSTSEVLNDLLLALSGNMASASSGKVTQPQLQDPTSGLSTGISSFLSSQSNSGAPKSYINWILFDEQFKLAKDANGNIIASGYSGFDQVKTSGSAYVHNLPLSVLKSGYLYIYTSNESQNIDVFFDNLQVTHIHGPMVEETHYYSFGLTMSGISSKAVAFGSPENKIKFQGQQFATKEFSDGSGLEMYEFKWRMEDPQIGRFWQIDPLTDKYVYNSTYAFSENKVTAHVELEGLEAISVAESTCQNCGVAKKQYEIAASNLPYHHYSSKNQEPDSKRGGIGMYSKYGQGGSAHTANKDKKDENIDKVTEAFGWAGKNPTWRDGNVSAWDFTKLFGKFTKAAGDDANNSERKQNESGMESGNAENKNSKSKQDNKSSTTEGVDPMFLKKGNVVYRRNSGENYEQDGKGGGWVTRRPATDTFPKNPY